MQPRGAAAGDPVLVAVDHVARAAPVRARGHVAGGAAGLGLGDADRRLVAGQHRLGPLALLRVAAVGHHRGQRAEIGFDRDPPGHRADPRHLLDHQRRVEDAETGSAVLGRDRHAHETGLGERRHVVPRVFAAVVDLGRARDEAGLGQRAGAGAQLPLAVAEVEVHRY